MSDAIAYLVARDRAGPGARRGRRRAQGRADLRSRQRRAHAKRRRDLQRPHRRDDGRIQRRAGDRRPGKIVVPGFIDTHCHVELSLITPLEFDRCVLRHGVTTAICDPHEIANVLGRAGLRYFLDGAMATAMDLRIQLSSCVPATNLETSGARLEVGDLVAARRSPEGARPRRIHELSRPARPRPGLPRQARRVPDPADRRAQPAARRLRAERLS